MLAESRARILEMLDDDDVVLDIGGGAHPFARADWVVDLIPFEDRGLYGSPDPDAERFGPETWLVRDICDRTPFPFDDDELDFAICSHILEDVRDPVWVCSELSRVARAGYVEVPSRLEEQSRGVHGPWAGWSHHRWLVDVEDGELVLVGKPGVLHRRENLSFPPGFAAGLAPERRVEAVFWEGEIRARERVFLDGPGLDGYLRELVERHADEVRRSAPSPLTRLRRRLRALR